jgi:hypothetical protein
VTRSASSRDIGGGKKSEKSVSIATHHARAVLPLELLLELAEDEEDDEEDEM